MKIQTHNVFPPIPNRNFDWSAIDADTYCCPECHSPVGYGPTEAAAIADLMEQIEPADDEPFWSDSDTTREMMNSIKGR